MTKYDVDRLRISLVSSIPDNTTCSIKSSEFKKVVNSYSDLLVNLIEENKLLAKQLADAKCDVRTVIKYVRSR